jgi:hypothetical protein
MKLKNSFFKYFVIITLTLFLVSQATLANYKNDSISTVIKINKENIDKIQDLLNNANKIEVIASDICLQNIKQFQNEEIKYLKRKKKERIYINSKLEKLFFYKNYFTDNLKDADYYFLTAKNKIPILLITSEHKHIKLTYKNKTDLEIVINARNMNNLLSFLFSRSTSFNALQINDLSNIYFEGKKNFIYYLHFKKNQNIEEDLIVYELNYDDYLAMLEKKKKTNYLYLLLAECNEVKIKITYEF